MSTKVQSLLLRLFAWGVLALVILNIVMVQNNRATAAENAAKQQFIQSTVALDTLNKEIVNALVELSVKKQDEQLRTLLSSNGITFNVNTPAEKK